jgi:phosphoenolpyruvate-protein phosphotransferase (PTS system enzyme I)
MEAIRGIAASPGIVTAKVFLYLEDTIKIPEYEIHHKDIEEEYNRFLEAREKASSELQHLRNRVEVDLNKGEGKFLDSHILMINDPEFTEKVERDLRKYRKNVEWILQQAMEGYIKQLGSSQDAYLRERSIDIHDVAKRVLNHLMYRERISLGDISEEVVLVTHNLLPSEALQMNKRMIKGIAMDAGGKTSHTAILARSFEIPAVLGLKDICSVVSSGDEIIIDGNNGVVIVEPDEETRNRYAQAREEWERRETELLTLNELPAETKDGKLISLKANVEMIDEVDSVLSHGADGIGLFRSEFLFLKSGGLADEELQYEYYSEVLERMKDSSVTLRTLDVGGDKLIPDVEGLGERNPILGWRAVRFCLARPEIFKAQLRALYRAGVKGNLRIMFPMISGIEELNQVFDVVDQVKHELETEGREYNPHVPLGIMIEVPSAALTADILAKRVSFFSIGTNDLIQYTIAVDRGNERIAYLYEPFHPGVLRLLKTIVESAHDQGIPVGMCGEMAGDPYASVILLGLGLDEYSMSPFGIPEIKKIIRSTSLTDAEELVGMIMDMKSYEEIDDFVGRWMDERFDIISS